MGLAKPARGKPVRTPSNKKNWVTVMAVRGDAGRIANLAPSIKCKSDNVILFSGRGKRMIKASNCLEKDL